MWTGSARSVEEFHMLDGIVCCREYLIAFGGHKLAAGLSMKADKEKLELFRSAINQQAAELDESFFEPAIYWDSRKRINEEELV